MHAKTRPLASALALLLVLAAALGLAACGDRDTDDGAAPAAQGIRFVDAELGRAVGGDRSITDPTEDFGPNDTIYVSIETAGSASTADLGARWTYEDGQEVERSQTTISPTGPEHTEFHISKPDGWPAGEYQVEITLDGRTVDTLEFEIDG